MGERKTPEEQLAALEARASVLKNRIAQVKARQKSEARKQDTRRKIIVGSTVLTEMAHNEELRVYIRGLLKKKVVRPLDQEAIADLLKP